MIYDFSYDGLKRTILLVSLVQARLMPLFLLLPFFNRNMVPRTAALGIAAAVGLIVVPTISPTAVDSIDADFIFLMIKEAFLGLVLGFLCALPFWIIEGIGFIVDNQRGASMAAVINPMTGNDSSPTGMMLGMAFVTYFFTIGGMTLLIQVIYDSYRLWPADSYWPALNLDTGGILFSQINRLMTITLILASPVLVLMFLIEIGLALISRFAPQLQVFFLAMPIKSAVGLFMLILFVASLFDFGANMLYDLRTWPERLSGAFASGAAR
jgi:type III secretion protein T